MTIHSLSLYCHRRNVLAAPEYEPLSNMFELRHIGELFFVVVKISKC